MSIFTEIMNGLQGDYERKAVRIPPKQFHELMSDPDAREYIELYEYKYHKLRGVPLIIDREVELWEVVEIED